MAYISDPGDVYTFRQGDIAYDALIEEVQRQILLYKECTNKKLQKVEELVEVAVEKMNLLRQMQVEKRGKRCVNHFGWKAKVRSDRIMQQPGVTPDATHHLESRLPKSRGTEVFECLEDSEEFIGEPIYDAALETCTRKPIYDEEQGEGQECQPEQAFNLATLNRGNLEALNPFQSEISKSEISEELEDYQEHPRYDEEPGETKEDWHSEEILLTFLGLEALAQHTQNLEEDNSIAVEGLDSRTDVRKPFASVPTAVVAQVPNKIHFEKIGEIELRRTSTEILSVTKEGLDQPKELKPDQASKDLTIQMDGQRLQCDFCLISASRDMVSAEEVSGKAVGSTQQQLSVEILIHYKPITIFDPGGCLSCLYEVICLLVTAGRINIPSARSTMRTWLFFKGGGMSG